MKKVAFFLFIFMALASVSFAQYVNMEVIIGNRPPSASEAQLMAAEENQHPNITRAMHDIDMAMHSLHDAPSDFGGHKGQAESDLKQAWISLRKALYFRLYKDTH
jgi:hypothetical protein